MSGIDNRADINNGDADVIMLGVGTSGEDLSLQLLDAGKMKLSYKGSAQEKYAADI
ncbi:MAG: hypothetical protein SCJ94_08105 [Bacillota bacterium]|nr:hypothetical protein [Bacillota bacterium]MDW7729956.1 hypothetical protein [Bacillota bacterium]